MGSKEIKAEHIHLFELQPSQAPHMRGIPWLLYSHGLGYGAVASSCLRFRLSSFTSPFRFHAINLVPLPAQGHFLAQGGPIDINLQHLGQERIKINDPVQQKYPFLVAEIL